MFCRLEELKKALSDRFEREFEEFSAMLEIKRMEMARLETETKKRKLEEEGRRLREVRHYFINKNILSFRFN